MSDYASLGIRTRPPVSGEPLTLTVVEPHSGLKGFVSERHTLGDYVVLPHANTILHLVRIPLELQQRLNIGSDALATFDVRTPDPFKSMFKDGLLIQGCEGHVSLQDLIPGMLAIVMR